MKNIKLYQPKENELDFAKNILNDPATMAYNKGYDVNFPGYDKETGTITPSDRYWEKWYDLYSLILAIISMPIFMTKI